MFVAAKFIRRKPPSVDQIISGSILDHSTLLHDHSCDRARAEPQLSAQQACHHQRREMSKVR